MSKLSQQIASLELHLAAINKDIAVIKTFMKDIDVATDNQKKTRELKNLDQEINNL